MSAEREHAIQAAQPHRFIRRAQSRGNCDICGFDKPAHSKYFPSHSKGTQVLPEECVDASPNDLGRVLNEAYQPLPPEKS